MKEVIIILLLILLNGIFSIVIKKVCHKIQPFQQRILKANC